MTERSPLHRLPRLTRLQLLMYEAQSERGGENRDKKMRMIWVFRWRRRIMLSDMTKGKFLPQLCLLCYYFLTHTLPSPVPPLPHTHSHSHWPPLPYNVCSTDFTHLLSSGHRVNIHFPGSTDGQRTIGRPISSSSSPILARLCNICKNRQFFPPTMKTRRCNAWILPKYTWICASFTPRCYMLN